MRRQKTIPHRIPYQIRKKASIMYYLAIKTMQDGTEVSVAKFATLEEAREKNNRDMASYDIEAADTYDFDTATGTGFFVDANTMFTNAWHITEEPDINEEIVL